ncbi:metal-binding protein [Deinococcus yavapaiensis]|uniref:Putative metal-binding protein n=1 Tax=Deinococcus yavapaiensis KR-236 TaxID=694435 RepID=A0A318SAE0_9DEIO|nr:metal-binding protein [Deinococcus yavapaiensis]PYE53498.1 putative metal-binding protein [Deinococcus yavapaiensis KR-236]
MPSGRTHNLINVGTFAVGGTIALFLQRADVVTISSFDAVTFTVGFFVGTFLLSPDLDLAEGHVSSKRAWGFLGFLWVPYGLLFSHRGWSHSWIVGPATRLVYLAIIVALVFGFLRLAWPTFGVPDVRVSWVSLLPLLTGYYVSSWLHLMADGVRPDHKMKLRPKRARR